MYNTYLLIGFLVVLAGLLMHFQPKNLDSDYNGIEGFSGAHAVDKIHMPECVSRSTDAQSLLGRIARYSASDNTAAELRLLLSKLCCMEADIAAPSAGVYRTQHLQFRTSQDMEPPATIVGRCLRNAVNKRDIELIIEKYKARGLVLIAQLCTDDLHEANAEFDKVVARLQFAMTTFCLTPQPSMDRPTGARDLGFYEPKNVAELDQYIGISAEPTIN